MRQESRVLSRISVARAVVVKLVAAALAFHQQAADDVGGNLLGGAGEEGLGEGWEGVVAMGVAWVAPKTERLMIKERITTLLLCEHLKNPSLRVLSLSYC